MRFLVKFNDRREDTTYRDPISLGSYPVSNEWAHCLRAGLEASGV